MGIIATLAIMLSIGLFVRNMTLHQQREEKDNEIYELNNRNKVLRNEIKVLENEVEVLELQIKIMDEVDNYTTKTSKKLINRLAQVLDKKKKIVGYSNDLLSKLDVIPKGKKDFNDIVVNYERIAEDLIGAAPEKPKPISTRSSWVSSLIESSNSYFDDLNRSRSSSISSGGSDYSFGYESSYSSSDSSSSSCSSSYSGGSHDSGGGFCD